MRLHHHDAERLLYEKAQFIYPDASRWRAIRIAFNQQQQKFSEHLRAHNHEKFSEFYLTLFGSLCYRRLRSGWGGRRCSWSRRKC